MWLPNAPFPFAVAAPFGFCALCGLCVGGWLFRMASESLREVVPVLRNRYPLHRIHTIHRIELLGAHVEDRTSVAPSSGRLLQEAPDAQSSLPLPARARSDRG
jgi:hypothetical protein